MLSICIPIYNFDCTKLVKDLLEQIKPISDKVEVLVMDDASEQEFREKFKQLPETVRFFQLKENIGRSRIRNRLAAEANYDWLLFLDGDSTIIRQDYLATFLHELELNDSSKVICGGSIYQEELPPIRKMLRWKYSKARERKSLSFSRKYPYRSFTSNNVVIEKKTFLQIKFDERIEDYGHEDTLFGYQLMKQKIPVSHINNVVLNGDLDDNKHYLNKSKESVSNLLLIAKYLDFDEEFIRLIPLLKVYFRLKIFGLEIFIQWWFRTNRKNLERKFVEGKVNLLAFDMYRLGVLSTLFKKG